MTSNEQLMPLLVNKSQLAKLMKVSRNRISEILFSLKVEPVPGFGKRDMFSYPQILSRLKTINEIPIGRRRAFRQQDMKNLLENQ